MSYTELHRAINDTIDIAGRAIEEASDPAALSALTKLVSLLRRHRDELSEWQREHEGLWR